MGIKKHAVPWFLLAACAMTAFKPAGDYRIYKKTSYRIMDTAGFYLYYRYVQLEQTKGKGLIKKHEYYFSRDGVSDILLLTIENLKKAYPENHRFHYDLDALFRSDNELMAYDPYARMYKIKYLYNLSVK